MNLLNQHIIKPNLKIEFNAFMEACKKNNLKVDDLKFYDAEKWPLDLIFNSIKKYNENKKFFTEKQWNDGNYTFRCCTIDTNFPLYIDFSYLYPNAKLISNKIICLGGKVFLVHLFTYPLSSYEKYEIFLDELVRESIIDGIEVYYSKFSDEQIKFLEDYCDKNNLLKSAGTGYGNMNISEKIVKNWI